MKQKALALVVETSEIKADMSTLAYMLAERIQKISTPEGTFLDPVMEAEFQEWQAARDRAKESRAEA